MPTGKNRKIIALLIDADNVPSICLDQLQESLEKIGELRIKRIYGDFSSSYLNGWKDKAVRCKLVPIQQFSKNGGNSTDMRLLIDAVDMTYVNQDINTFCIASSDADYTSLILRLKESGKYVIVAGKDPISNEMILSSDDVIRLKINKQPNQEKEKQKSTCSQGVVEYILYGDDENEVYKMTPFGIISDIIRKKSDQNGFCNMNDFNFEFCNLIRKNHDLICFPKKLNSNSNINKIIEFYKDHLEFSGENQNKSIRLKKPTQKVG